MKRKRMAACLAVLLAVHAAGPVQAEERYAEAVETAAVPEAGFEKAPQQEAVSLETAAEQEITLGEGALLFEETIPESAADGADAIVEPETPNVASESELTLSQAERPDAVTEYGLFQSSAEDLDADGSQMLQSAAEDPDADTASAEYQSVVDGQVILSVEEIPTPESEPEEEAVLTDTITVESCGDADDGAVSWLRYRSVGVYTDSYGAQIDNVYAADLYRLMKEEYVTNRGCADIKYEFPKDPVSGNRYEDTAFTAYPTASDATASGWDFHLQENAEYRELTSSIMQPVFDAFVYDYPEVFWMGSCTFRVSMSYAKSELESGAVKCWITSFTVVPKEKYAGARDGAEIARFDRAVDQAVAEIRGTLSDNPTRYEQVGAIHDYVCEHAEYQACDYAWSAAGFFLYGGQIVCEGYAKAVKILCGRFGIPAVLIPGMTYGASEGHMWNYVTMEDGCWYLVDATWDDGSSVKRTYFLVGSGSPSATMQSGSRLTIGQERAELYTNFSGSSYSQSFTLPNLSEQAYQSGAPLTHSWQFAEKKEPTCAENGFVHYACADAGCSATRTEILPKSHSFAAYVSDGNATCTADGTKTRRCSRCGVSETVAESGSALGHSFMDYISDGNATCTKDGTKTRRCSRCGEPETIADPGSALGHSFTGYVSDGNATCTTNGTRTRRCSRCQETETVPDPGTALGHSFTHYRSNEDATVFSDGTKTAYCDRCGAVHNETAIGSRLTASWQLNAAKLTLKTGQSTTALKLSGLARGDSVVSWTSSKPSIVKVTANGSTVKITAKKKTGSAFVIAVLASGARIEVPVKVQKTEVQTTSVSSVPKTVSLEIGEKYRLSPVVAPITSKQKLTYSSSNKKIATVSKQGVITARKSGKVKITVRSGKKKATVTVVVKGAATKKLTGVPGTLTLKKGKTRQLKVKRLPAASSEAIRYSSSDKKVVSVSSKGKITAKRKGRATITVRSGAVSVSCSVLVK